MLATLNPKQIVDEIVKDTVKDNDPHDAVQISPDIVLASRPVGVAPALAPDIAPRPEPKFAPEPKASFERKITLEPRFGPISESQAAPPPSVDAPVRVAASDGPAPRQRSGAAKWLRGVFVTFLFAGGSAAATIVWAQHGDTAKQMLAEWTPTLASLLPSTSQTAPAAAAQVAPAAEQAATDQTAGQSATPPAVQVAAAAPAATQPDAAQSVQSMTRDLAAMTQQIEALKADIAALKAGQEQMAREMAKPPAPKPTAEVKPVDPRARAAALPPRAPSPPPVRKPKPVVSHTYMPAYSPAPLAPQPSQAAAMPPPPVAPVTTTQAVADDDGPVVRPPMPLR